MNKQSYFVLLVLLVVTLMLVGCTTKTEYVTVHEPIPLYHAPMPDKPTPPQIVGPSVLTTDNASRKLKANQAYIMFPYLDWLEFARWMHDDKAYKKQLIEVINNYKEQDIEKVNDTDSGRTGER